MKRLPLAALGLLLLQPQALAGQQAAVPPDQPYLLLRSVGTKSLQTGLTEAAKSGYRVMMLMNGIDPGNNLLLTRPPRPEPVEYLVLGVSRIPTLQKELNEGAAQGFRLLPDTPVLKSEFVAIMEKRPDAVQRYEYLVAYAMRSKTMEKEIQRTLDQGWQMCWLCRPQMLPFAILERPAGAPAGTAAEIKDADMRFRLFAPKSHATFNDELAALASQGHRVVLPPRQANSASVLIEKLGGMASGAEYRVLGPKDSEELEESVLKAGADGFRLRWPTLLYVTQSGSGAQVFVFAEKAPATEPPCGYQVLKTTHLVLSGQVATPRRDEFSQRISMALQDGFKVRDGVVWKDDWLLFLEKCGR